MAIVPLYMLKDAKFFEPDTIAIKCSCHTFAPVHGKYTGHWNNGTHPDTDEHIPGAFDSTAEANAQPLPKPLLTGKDRMPLTKDPNWSIGDLGIVEDSTTFTKGSIVQLFRDDGSYSPLWALVKGHTPFDCADGVFGAFTYLAGVKKITPAFEQPEEATDMPTSGITFRTGTYIDCRGLTDAQVERFVDDARPFVRDIEVDYKDFIRNKYHFLVIDRDGDLWSTFCIHDFMDNDVTEQYTRGEAPMSRNPFQTGDKVIPTGFGAKPDGNLAFGSNPTMEQWQHDKTVLTVAYTNGHTVLVGDGDRTYSYHYAELRMAAPAEVAAAESPAVPEVVLEKGMIIKTDNGCAAMIVRSNLDNDGDIFVAEVETGIRHHFRVRGPEAKPFTILGRIMPDGDFRPAKANTSDGISQDPATWKPGDKLRCGTTSSSYLTEGKIYEIESIDHRAGSVTIKAEDDGTPGERSLSGVYGWEKIANG